MSRATVFIFAPVEEARDSHRRLEAEGVRAAPGQASWDTPQGNREPELVRMAQGAHALMGTSIRNVPISRTIMESSPELRIVAKYTIGVDDVDVEAATEMGILVCHGPTESNWGGVAEGTITAMLTMLKKVRERDRHLKDGGAWRDPALQGTYLGLPPRRLRGHHAWSDRPRPHRQPDRDAPAAVADEDSGHRPVRAGASSRSTA